ncbi:phage GP46 family protein [Candidatus Pacearchaeota archaeon]|nr:phage GP46 family protein [Candidatus Pacearchaeota archaeon]
MDAFAGDVKMKQEDDGGNIEFINGQPVMTGGFETATYFSLFGGNEDDDGSKDNPLQYWGNLLETEDPSKRYVSETQYLLRGLPASSANLRKIEEAAKRDTQWFIDTNAADKVTIVATIPALNKINISVTITAEGEETNFNFTENWKAMSNGA